MESSFYIEETVINVLYYEDIDGQYTVTLLERGGPIVTAPTLDKAKDKFSAMMKLAIAVRNLQFFKAANRARTARSRRKNASKMKETFGNMKFNYREVKAA